MVFGPVEFIFWDFRVNRLLPTGKTEKNTGKFTCLITWLTAVTIFYYPFNAVLNEHFKNMVIFAVLNLIPELSRIKSQPFDLTP